MAASAGSGQSEGFVFIESIEDKAPTIPPDSTVSRTVVNKPETHIIVFGFAAGEELSEHTSARAAILHFVRGQARLVLGGKEHQAGPGTVVYMEPRLPHSVFAETETVMLLTMVGA